MPIVAVVSETTRQKCLALEKVDNGKLVLIKCESEEEMEWLYSWCMFITRAIDSCGEEKE